MRVVLVFLAILALAKAVPEKRDNRVIGGIQLPISSYPFSVAVLYSRRETDFQQYYGGAILNQRSILTAARPFHYFGCCVMNRWRLRVGSTYASSGGTVHIPSQIISHRFDPNNNDNDIAIFRTSTFIQYIPNLVGPARIAGENYTIPDNAPVYGTGWGQTSLDGQNSELFHHVLIWKIPHEVCKQRYATVGYEITDNMLCAGWLNYAGRGQCEGDTGSPLVRGLDVIVGVASWGHGCADFFPGVNTRVSNYANWIFDNA